MEQFKGQKDHKRIDKIILEKMIYALHLLERLKANGLDFVFRGGTSLVLLFKEVSRFSIDIDIVCKTEKKDLEEVLNKVIKTSRFIDWKLDEYRSYQVGVPKAHYKFSFDSKQQGSGTILLDVLIEDSIYPAHSEIPVKTKWVKTEAETIVTVPTIDAITGDKLTAFAPNTVGIPYFKGKDKQSFDFGFLMSGSFRIDDAVPAAARIAYLAAKILVNDMSPIAYYKGQDIKGLSIEDKDWNFLNKLKRQPNKSSFYYWYQTVQIIAKKGMENNYAT